MSLHSTSDLIFLSSRFASNLSILKFHTLYTLLYVLQCPVNLYLWAAAETLPEWFWLWIANSCSIALSNSCCIFLSKSSDMFISATASLRALPRGVIQYTRMVYSDKSLLFWGTDALFSVFRIFYPGAPPRATFSWWPLSCYWTGYVKFSFIAFCIFPIVEFGVIPYGGYG